MIKSDWINSIYICVCVCVCVCVIRTTCIYTVLFIRNLQLQILPILCTDNGISSLKTWKIIYRQYVTQLHQKFCVELKPEKSLAKQYSV
jgi:hypothetical protein